MSSSIRPYLHGRDQTRKQVIIRAVIVAVAITAKGQREVLGIEVGGSEDETFSTDFLRRLRESGLSGVQLGCSPQPVAAGWITVDRLLHAKVVHDITALLAMARWRSQPNPC